MGLIMNAKLTDARNFQKTNISLSLQVSNKNSYYSSFTFGPDFLFQKNKVISQFWNSQVQNEYADLRI